MTSIDHPDPFSAAFAQGLHDAIFGRVEPIIHKRLAHTLFSAYAALLDERAPRCVRFFTAFVHAVGLCHPAALAAFNSPEQAARATWGAFLSKYSPQFVEAVAKDYADGEPWTLPGPTAFLPDALNAP